MFKESTFTGAIITRGQNQRVQANMGKSHY